MNSRLGGDGCQHWVPTGSQQHGNLTGALVLRGSALFHRHLSETAQRKDGVEWEGENGDRSRGDAQEAVWTTQLEVKVRSEGRNTKNTSAPAVEEEVLVFLHMSRECPCGSQRCHCTEALPEGMGLGCSFILLLP